MTVANPASALGEAVGKLIENQIYRCLSPVCESLGFYYDHGGSRPGIRSGVELTMVNKSGNKYKLDGVIENKDRNPIILLESKYIRYKKHNRDKASWTAAAHYSLRKTHPTIRKSITILSGRWSAPSKAFLESFGIELFEIPFSTCCKVLATYGIDFDWDEKDRVTPTNSFLAFNSLSDIERQKLGEALTQDVEHELIDSVTTTLQLDSNIAQRIGEIELLIKTTTNEHFAYTFTKSREAIDFLLNLQVEREDLRGEL